LYQEEKNDAYKPVWLSLLVAVGETKGTLEDFGFEMGRRVYRTAVKKAKEGKAGIFEKPTGRPSKLTLEELEKIFKILEKDSFYSPNVTISHKIFDKNAPNFLTPKKVTEPVKFLNNSKEFLFGKYLQAGGIYKRTQFRFISGKYFPQFKIPKKVTDLCCHCESGKDIQKKYDSLYKEFCSCDEENCTCTIPEHLREQLLSYQMSLKVVELHRKQKNAQRQSFKKQKKDLEENECLILIDFKSNILLKESQRQQGRDWFNRPQRTCFGAVVFYQKNGVLEKHFYDIFSSNLTHDCLFVKTALDSVFKDQWFVDQSFKNAFFWMDGGKHFKNLELGNYFKNLYDDKTFTKLEWNFFIENHGKNDCDGRFATLNGFLNSYTSQEGKSINNTKELIKAVQEGQMKSNLNRLAMKEKMMFSTQLEIEVPDPTEEVVKLKIKGITTFHSIVFCKKVMF
jgi:hypothetical protein